VNWVAVQTTIKLASLTTVVLLILTIPLAYWLTFSPQRRWKFLVETVFALPLVLPPTVLGYYILVATGPRSIFGQTYEALLGHALPFTFQGLVIASVIYSFPFAVQPLTVAFRAVDAVLIEASLAAGASRMTTFRRVILPLSLEGVVTAVVLSFAHTLGEFGVVLMVGGNIEGVTRTISIDIYDKVQALDYTGAGQTAFALVIFSFVVLSIVYAMNRKLWPGWPNLFGTRY
jgi:molybdate transport system permease protein